MTRSSEKNCRDIFLPFQRRLLRYVSLFVVVTVTAVMASCNNEDEKEKKEVTVTEDSLQTVASIASEDSEIIFSNQASGWIGGAMRKNVSDWSRFHLEEFWSDDSLEAKAFQPEKDFYKDYASVLRWSPDSSYVLDFGSYGHVRVTDHASGKTRLEGGEPDTEVALIDPKSNIKTRLLFFGPAATVFDSRWLDSSQVAVIGTYDENNDNHPDTIMWIIDAKDKFFRKYKWD